MEPFHLRLYRRMRNERWRRLFPVCERKRKKCVRGAAYLCAPIALVGSSHWLLTFREPADSARACGMELQQIIPGTVKQGYLTKSPPLDKGGLKVRYRSLMQSLSGGVALALHEAASAHQKGEWSPD